MMSKQSSGSISSVSSKDHVNAILSLEELRKFSNGDQVRASNKISDLDSKESHSIQVSKSEQKSLMTSYDSNEEQVINQKIEKEIKMKSK